MKTKTKNWLASILAFLISSGSACAFSASVVSSVTDNSIGGAFKLSAAGDIQIVSTTVFVGDFNGEYLHSVFVFQMPDFPNYQTTNLKGSLDFSVSSYTGSVGLLDLVGIRVSSDRTVLASDFDSLPDVTILSGVTDNNFDVAYDNSALNSWIDNNYGVGDYLFLGLRTQSRPAQFNNLQLEADATLTLVPQIPVYALIIGSAAMGFVMVRHRRKG